MSLGMPTVSANGAIIGMDSTARPEEEGTMRPKKIKIRSCPIIKTLPCIPLTKCDR